MGVGFQEKKEKYLLSLELGRLLLLGRLLAHLVEQLAVGTLALTVGLEGLLVGVGRGVTGVLEVGEQLGLGLSLLALKVARLSLNVLQATEGVTELTTQLLLQVSGLALALLGLGELAGSRLLAALSDANLLFPGGELVLQGVDLLAERRLALLGGRLEQLHLLLEHADLLHLLAQLLGDATHLGELALVLRMLRLQATELALERLLLLAELSGLDLEGRGALSAVALKLGNLLAKMQLRDEQGLLVDGKLRVGSRDAAQLLLKQGNLTLQLNGLLGAGLALEQQLLAELLDRVLETLSALVGGLELLNELGLGGLGLLLAGFE